MSSKAEILTHSTSLQGQGFTSPYYFNYGISLHMHLYIENRKL